MSAKGRNVNPWASALAMLRCVNPAVSPWGGTHTGRSDQPRTGGSCASRNAALAWMKVAEVPSVERMPSSISPTVKRPAGPVALNVP